MTIFGCSLLLRSFAPFFSPWVGLDCRTCLFGLFASLVSRRPSLLLQRVLFLLYFPGLVAAPFFPWVGLDCRTCFVRTFCVVSQQAFGLFASLGSRRSSLMLQRVLFLLYFPGLVAALFSWVGLDCRTCFVRTFCVVSQQASFANAAARSFSRHSGSFASSPF